MSTDEKHIRNGMGVVRPYLFGRLDLLDFVRQVFGAEEVQTLGERHTKYVGENVRFRYERGGQFRLRMTAIGIIKSRARFGRVGIDLMRDPIDRRAESGERRPP